MRDLDVPLRSNRRWRPLNRLAAPVTVLVVGLVMTASAAFFSYRSLHESDRRMFRNSTQEIESAIAFRMQAYISALIQIRGLFSIGREPTVMQLREYVDASDVLEVYPGLLGIGYSKRLRQSELPQHIAEMRRIPGYQDYEHHPVGNRSEHHAIVMLEPLNSRNRLAIGFDMFSEPVRRSAMERARDSGNPQMSSAVKLIQNVGSERAPGFLIYVPVYLQDTEPRTVEERRESLRGFVYSPFRARDLFNATLSGIENNLEGIGFRLFDGNGAHPSKLIYGKNDANIPDQPSLELIKTLSIAGHVWTLQWFALPNFGHGPENKAPTYLIMLGGIVSLLLAGVVWSITHSRHIAEQRSLKNRFSADVSTMLGSSLQPASTIQQVATYSSQYLADYCLILLVDEAGSQLVVAHHGKELIRQGWDRAKGKVPAVNDCAEPAAVEQPKLEPTEFWELVRRYVDGINLDAELVNTISEAVMGAHVVIPMGARGPFSGLVLLANEPSSEPFGEDDLDVARETVGRLTHSIANAMLYHKADRAMRDREAILQYTGDGIYGIDASGKMAFVNPAAARMVGWSAEEMLGKNPHDLFHHSHADGSVYARQNCLVDRALVEGRSFSADDEVFWRSDGTSFPVEYISNPILEQGQIVGTVVSFRDITFKKAAENALKDSEEKFRQLADNIPQLFWIFDTEIWRYSYLSPSCEAIYGYSPAHIESGLDFLLERIHPEDRSATSACIERQLKGETTHAEFRFERGDGREVWLSVHAFPIKTKEGKIYRIAGITEDVTERKHFEQELRRAKDLAERASQAKSDFLANMSHEIRTPLNSVMGFTELLLNQSTTNEDRSRYASAIMRNGRLLTQIIDDILDLSKVEAGKLSIEQIPSSLQTIVADVTALLSQQAHEKGIYLRAASEGDVPDRIVTDPTRLKQILFNIIGNAIKFTATGGVDVILRCSGADDGGSRMLDFVVRDTGCGIPSDRQSELFRPFMQADSSTTRKFGGTGLGLTLAKRLAEALGGTVRLESSVEGKGSTFVVSVAACDAAGRLEMEARVSTRQDSRLAISTRPLQKLNGISVLVVEDAPDNQMLIGQILRSHGARIALAENGQEAVRKAMSEDFDLVLMDLQMPVMDGFDATAELRQRGFRKPILAVSAAAMQDDRDRAIAAGCNDHVTKPVSANTVVEKIIEHARTNATAIN
jgi:PAS domain S-box-containing protein